MCTTVLLLGTLVMMLRRRFFNKVEPYVLSRPLPTSESGEVKLALNEPIKSGREKQDSKQGRHLLACMPPALPVLPAALAKLRTH
uniref:Uncharacterized protein n=1 Tax=Accipiter nisus TaxID=211598 RepID=A0A8B9N9I1_9AVES